MPPSFHITTVVRTVLSYNNYSCQEPVSQTILGLALEGLWWASVQGDLSLLRRWEN